MTTTTDLLRRAAQELLDDCMMVPRGPERDAKRALADSVADIARQMERAEPVGAMYRHEKTGRTAFVELDRADVFDHQNLRWNYAGRLYLHPAPEVPEGCTPADAKMLRAANHAFAQEKHELIDLLREFAPEGEITCDECGGDDAECPANCMVRRARARIKDYDSAAMQEPKP